MKSKKIAMAGVFSAIIIVLQLIGTFVKFGPVNINLALAPIIIGAALYGRRFSLLLGTVLGVFIAIMGAFGWDGGFVLSLATYHPVIIYLVAISKTAVAGYLAGVVYELVSKRNTLLAVVLAGIVCPVVNTGIFVAAMVVFFKEALLAMAGGTDIFTFIVLGLTGVNFLIELVVNLVSSTAITRIIKAIKR